MPTNDHDLNQPARARPQGAQLRVARATRRPTSTSTASSSSSPASAASSSSSLSSALSWARSSTARSRRPTAQRPSGTRRRTFAGAASNGGKRQDLASNPAMRAEAAAAADGDLSHAASRYRRRQAVHRRPARPRGSAAEPLQRAFPGEGSNIRIPDRRARWS